MVEDVDDIARKVADSWDQEAEKFSTEEYANDPEAHKAYVLLKIFARLAREGKIQESLSKAMETVTTMTPEELGAYVENFQKEKDVDLAGEMEKIVSFMAAGLQAQKPSETAADDLIRSMFTGK
jgi:hypothetical protein